MEISKEHKEKLCDTNKKVSFSQRGSIETKKSKLEMLLESQGIYFKVNNGEIIESAIFERITRDCGGELIRKNLIRRFRKVGYDEWFSIEAPLGNEYWENEFLEASTDDAIVQYESNLINETENKLPSIEDKPNKIKLTERKMPIVVPIAILALVTFTYYKLF
jgi:hypothetical protein